MTDFTVILTNSFFFLFVRLDKMHIKFIQQVVEQKGQIFFNFS